MTQYSDIPTEAFRIYGISNVTFFQFIGKTMVIMKDKFGKIHVREICEVVEDNMN